MILMNLEKMLKQSLVSSHLLKNVMQTHLSAEQMHKKWNSPIYAFFDPSPIITHEGMWKCHTFKCAACSCKVTVHHLLDKQDATSTGNMWKYVLKCWGGRVLQNHNAGKYSQDCLHWVSFQGLGQLQLLLKGQAREKWLTVTTSIQDWDQVSEIYQKYDVSAEQCVEWRLYNGFQRVQGLSPL